ncbi:MAG TPA: hypothetical protein VN642_07735 [Dongiaceae bacterium]|nr:hypothetical protein [Dongiaceae bacterium]
MKMRNLSSLLLSLLTLIVVGCGGGSGGGDLTPVATTLSGEATKGPIIGGDVKIFAINADGTLQSTPLPTLDGKPVTTRAPFGNYSAVINYEGPVKVVVTGNTGSIYKDEASGTDVPFAGKSLSAVVANVSGSSKVSITPFTELAAQKAGTTKLTPANIKAANTAVTDALGLQGVDIVATTPSSNPEYKFNLAVVSQAAGPSADDLSKLLTQTASAIDATTGTITDTALDDKFIKATTDAFKNTKINPAGAGIPGIDPAKVTGITLSAPSTIVAASSSVKISANVTTISGGPPAAGTVVTFAASAGTISNVTTTANGIATATLSGITSPQTVSIKAVVGIIKGSEININFVDPNSPSNITVTDAPGAHFINSTVPLTVKVVSVSGGTISVGQKVDFVITSGSGSLSQSSSTIDANGNASVSVTSAVAGVVTVKITAGQATGSHSITFSDPNQPDSISLVADRTSGITGNRGPVTLTATVVPTNILNGTITDGTPVTFTILNGNGTLSSATANTKGGVASVILNSTVAGAIDVVANATVGATPVTSNPLTVTFTSQPTQVAVKLRTTGTLPAGTTIGALKVTVTATPSSGLTMTSDPNGSTPDVSATGAGVGSQIITNSNNVAAVTLALVNTKGIQTGEFATLNFNVTAGSFPKASDFAVALNGSVIDSKNAPIAGIIVEILSVNIQ